MLVERTSEVTKVESERLTGEKGSASAVVRSVSVWLELASACLNDEDSSERTSVACTPCKMRDVPGKCSIFC